jgi:hypothetical protein
MNNFRSFTGEVFVTLFITFAFDFFEICARRKAQERRRNNNNFRSLQRVMKISDDECRTSSNGKGESAAATTISELDVSISDDELQEELMGK